LTKILPTVGRVVWITPLRVTGDYGFTHIDARKPLAAIVTHVFNDELLNLTVFDSNGVPHSRTSVRLVQAGEDRPEHAYFCEWMPYRVGQAAKQAKPG
jgi:hypothetical protein